MSSGKTTTTLLKRNRDLEGFPNIEKKTKKLRKIEDNKFVITLQAFLMRNKKKQQNK